VRRETHAEQHADWIAAARREAQRIRAAGGSSADGIGLGRPAQAASLDLRDYDIIREVHRGGQGVVYEARQRSIPRTVAVKVLHTGPFAGETDRVRFEREISILAQLRHRNIVGILDRGDACGCHYLVMDFVDGRPLDRYAREQGLDLRARLKLFAAVCDAVSAAHLRAVIHRDLKPANILIDAAGEPRILDFGLAMMVDGDRSPGTTITGQFVGSLPWVAPEQALGLRADVDVRSDVYSLGVILYQLLTDRFPYSTVGNLEEVLTRIRSAEPTPPRALNAQVDDELETIALKCLQKDPARRYQSVGELARDARHYLAGEPIAAKRDSSWYVLRKMLRRYRAAALVAAAFLVVISVGFVIAVVLWQRAALDRDRAVRAETSERSARQQAEDEAAKARAVNQFLQNALAAASPEVAARREVSVRELLDNAVREIDAGSLAEQPSVESAVRATIGNSYLALGRAEQAVAQFDSALALIPEADGMARSDEGNIQRQLAEAYLELARTEEAEALARQALASIRQAHDGDHLELVAALRTMARVHLHQGRPAESMALRHEALAMHARVLGEDHVDVLHSRLVLAVNDHNMAEVEVLTDRLTELYESGAEHVDANAVRVFRTLGGVRHIQGDYAGAEHAYGRALEIIREVYGSDHPLEIAVRMELAFLHRSAGAPEGGEAELAQVCEIARRVFGADDSRYADLLVQRAALALGQDNPAKAESLVKQVLNMSTAGNPADDWTRAQARSLLGDIMLRRGDLDDAEPLLLEGYAGIVASEIPGSLQWHAAKRLVRLYQALGDKDQAAAWQSQVDQAQPPSRVDP